MCKFTAKKGALHTMWSDGKTTRKKSTDSEYQMRYALWQKELAQKYGISEKSIPAILVAKHVIEHSRQRRTATWRKYRAAIIEHITRTGESEAEVLAMLNEETNRRRMGEKPSDSQQEDRTTSSKLKGFTKNQLAVIQYRINQLIDEGCKSSKDVIAIINTIHITGMRPIEIATSKINRDEYGQKRIVTIINAKATNGRSNGEVRELMIVNASDGDIENIIHGIQVAKTIFDGNISKGEDYDEARKKTAAALAAKFKNWRNVKLINWILKNNEHKKEKRQDWVIMINETGIDQSQRSVKRLVEQLKKTSLYTFRHQMFANAKSAIGAGLMTPVQAAATGGHASVFTHKKHYGITAHGSSGAVKALPTEESVKAVLNHGNSTSSNKAPAPENKNPVMPQKEQANDR